jgi:hypothetical protein
MTYIVIQLSFMDSDSGYPSVDPHSTSRAKPRRCACKVVPVGVTRVDVDIPGLPRQTLLRKLYSASYQIVRGTPDIIYCFEVN